MRGIRRHTESDNLAADSGPPRLRTFERLDHQHARAFAKNHSFTIFGKRTAGIRRNHPHRLPRFKKAEAEWCFASARDSRIDNPVANHPERLADSMIGR